MMTSRPLLYSYRRCPYAMRARISLLIANIEFDIHEIVLKDKPAAMLAASPKALCLSYAYRMAQSLTRAGTLFNGLYNKMMSAIGGKQHKAQTILPCCIPMMANLNITSTVINTQNVLPIAKAARPIDSKRWHVYYNLSQLASAPADFLAENRLVRPISQFSLSSANLPPSIPSGSPNNPSPHSINGCHTG